MSAGVSQHLLVQQSPVDQSLAGLLLAARQLSGQLAQPLLTLGQGAAQQPPAGRGAMLRHRSAAVIQLDAAAKLLRTPEDQEFFQVLPQQRRRSILFALGTGEQYPGSPAPAGIRRPDTPRAVQPDSVPTDRSAGRRHRSPAIPGLRAFSAVQPAPPGYLGQGRCSGWCRRLHTGRS